DRAQLFDVATGRELLDLDSQRLIVGRTLRISGEAGVGGQIRLAEGLGEDAEEPVVGHGDDDEAVGGPVGVEGSRDRMAVADPGSRRTVSRTACLSLKNPVLFRSSTLSSTVATSSNRTA